jgi:FG-GAP-like repeat
MNKSLINALRYGCVAAVLGAALLVGPTLGAHAAPPTAFAKWYSDGTVDSNFLYQTGIAIGGSLGTCSDLRMIRGDFNGDKLSDVLVYCPSTGAFAKMYGTGGMSPQFLYQAEGYAGGAPGAWTSVGMVAADFNGDGKTDILAFRSDNGAYAKWYSDGGVDATFLYQTVHYADNAPGKMTNVGMVAADFNGDGKTDILVYDHDYFAKWYSDGGVDSTFLYQALHLIGGGGTKLVVPADFNGDGRTDVLVYIPASGTFAKWYSDGGVDSTFLYQTPHLIGGGWTNIAVAPADFNGDGRTDLVVYIPASGTFAKWYSDGGVDSTFLYQTPHLIGGGWTNIAVAPADFNGDGRTDLVVYIPGNGTFAKWYSDGGVDSTFLYQTVHYGGGIPGKWTNVGMVAADFNGDGKTDILVYHT